MAKRISLADQLAQLDDVAPLDFDPEDAHITGDAGEAAPVHKDLSAARAHYVDVGPSALRKLHDSIADPKYDGRRISRKQLLQFQHYSDHSEDEEEEHDVDGLSDNEQELIHEVDDRVDSPAPDHAADHSDGAQDQGDYIADDDNGQDAPSSSGTQSESNTTPQSDEEGDENDESEANDDDENEDDGTEGNRQHDDDNDDGDQGMSTALRKAREEDRKKGKAVSQQLAIWDSLLDARIRLQKAVAASNRFPMPSRLPDFLSSPESRDAVDKLLVEALSLSEELCDFQEKIMSTQESFQPPPRKRRKISPDLSSYEGIDFDDELVESTRAAFALEQAYHPRLLTTLQKWSAKIQAVAPSVLLPSTRNAFSSHNNNKSSSAPKSAAALVDEALLDADKLRARTRTLRTKTSSSTTGHYRIGEGVQEGKDGEEEEDMEIFDDTDFYQQLLRDVIDAKSGANADWMAMQRERKAAKKKQVDTKASKGRKIRYQVHEKLQNFMVPVPAASGWHEEQIDELFASLLGDGGGEAHDHDHHNTGAAADDEDTNMTSTNALVDQAIALNGFRVF